MNLKEPRRFFNLWRGSCKGECPFGFCPIALEERRPFAHGRGSGFNFLSGHREIVFLGMSSGEKKMSAILIIDDKLGVGL